MKLTQIKQKKSKFSKEIIVVLSHLLLFCNRCTLLPISLPKISEAARAAARKGQDCGKGWAILISDVMFLLTFSFLSYSAVIDRQGHC